MRVSGNGELGPRLVSYGHLMGDSTIGKVGWMAEGDGQISTGGTEDAHL